MAAGLPTLAGVPAVWGTHGLSGGAAAGRAQAPGKSWRRARPAGTWIVSRRQRGTDPASLAGEKGWARLSSDPSFAAWTDDYSNIVGVLGVAPP